MEIKINIHVMVVVTVDISFHHLRLSLLELSVKKLNSDENIMHPPGYKSIFKT